MTENIDPETSAKLSDKKRLGCWPISLIILLVLLVIGHFTTPGLVRFFANRTLPDALDTEATLETLSLNLARGRVGFGGLNIQQPAGFEGEPLLELSRFHATAPLGKAFRRNPLTIHELKLNSMTLRLQTDQDGVLNLTKLGIVEPDPEDEPPPPDVPPTWLRHLLLENIRITFHDAVEEWDLNVEDFRFELHNLRIANAEGEEGPATFNGEFRLIGPEVDARFNLFGKVGMLHPNQPQLLPPLQLALGLIGFDLDIIDPYLARGARTALDGGGIDFLLFMEIGEGDSPEDQSLYGSYSISTDRGTQYAGELGGTLDKPRLPFLNILGDILGAQFGRVTRLGGNVVDGGLDALMAAAETGEAALRGVTDTARGTAEGLLRTARGVVTLDPEEAARGVRDTTVGTAEDVTAAVTDTVGTAAGGVGRAIGTAVGHRGAEDWRETIDERVELFAAAAEEWLADRPFPGTD